MATTSTAVVETTIDRLREARRMTLVAATPIEAARAGLELREPLVAHAVASKESML